MDECCGGLREVSVTSVSGKSKVSSPLELFQWSDNRLEGWMVKEVRSHAGFILPLS